MGNNKDIVKALSMFSQLTITILFPIFLFLFLGIWIDNKFHTWTTVPLLIFGVMVGAMSGYRLIKFVLKSQKKPEQEEEYDLMVGWKEDDDEEER